MRITAKKTQQAWRRAVILLALLVLTLPAAMVSAQSGGIGGRVVNPDPTNPRSKSIFIYTLKRGESKKDQLLVTNQSDKEQTIAIGSVDGVVTNSGDYTCRQEAEPVEDSGGWVELSKKEVTLPSGGKELVDFTVTVPENADVGEHNSCITILAAHQFDETAPSGGVRLRTRQAIRMVITIPGELKRDISIKDFTVDNGSSGEQNYTITAANKGNVSADIYMNVHLASWLDNRWFSVDNADVGGEYPVVPNESLTKQFTTNILPMFGGWYKATPSLRYDKRMGAFGASSQQAEYETITGESVAMFFWPTTVGWIILAAIVVLILAFIIFMIVRARKRRRLKNSAKKYKVHKSDTIQSLAEESQVSWQDLAKLNKLSAPYLLKEGQEILLPTPVTHKSPKKRGSAKKKD